MHNNNNASCLLQTQYEHHHYDTGAHLARHSHTLNIIRSVIDELYQISKESKEKRVRFTVEEEEEEADGTESSTVACYSINGRSKVDCSVSTNDFPSLQCECATQTMNKTEYHHSLTSLLTDIDDFHRSTSGPTLSLKPTTIHHFPSTNHSLYFCENSETLPSITTSHQLVLPSDAQNYDICEEQTQENFDTFSTYTMQSFNSSIHYEDLTQLNDHHSFLKSNVQLADKAKIKLCTCSKRKRSDNHSPLNNSTSFDHGRSVEELYLSSRSLQSMYNDGLFYIHDLVLVFLKNPSQFDQILIEHYHVSKRQANLFLKVMGKWWKKHQREHYSQVD